MLKRAVAVAVLSGFIGVSLASAGGSHLAWHDTATGTTAHFRGLSAVSTKTAWVSGYTADTGVVLRTTNRGTTWKDVSPADSAGLQFRDIEAFDADNAVLISIGANPGDFKMYRTSNGGHTWKTTYVNSDPGVFLDCMTFFDRKHGLVLSDPPDGVHFRIFGTDDGGKSWHITGEKMPDALPGEFAFAASGQCLTSNDGRKAWFGTGGAAQARVFRSDDRGKSWKVSSTPIASGPAAGIFGLAFRSDHKGIAVGGDFTLPTNSPDNFAKTRDGGRNWKLIGGAPAEYRSGVTWRTWRTAIAVGPSGSDVSTNGGRTWQGFDDGSLDTVDCANPWACWASGENGRVAYLTGG